MPSLRLLVASLDFHSKISQASLPYGHGDSPKCGDLLVSRSLDVVRFSADVPLARSNTTIADQQLDDFVDLAFNASFGLVDPADPELVRRFDDASSFEPRKLSFYPGRQRFVSMTTGKNPIG
ncbi:hypothetical protein PPUN110474_27500 [Pseudomonas putida]|nr:hypothetical protein PPUN110474_27500 [Pseudomonas putida]